MDTSRTGLVLEVKGRQGFWVKAFKGLLRVRGIGFYWKTLVLRRGLSKPKHLHYIFLKVALFRF